MATVYYADDGDYTVREAELLAGLDMEDRVPVRLGDHARMAWRFELHPTRAAAVAALIEAANNRIAVGQEAHRALARLKRDPDAPNADAVGEPDRTTLTVADFSSVDAALAIPVTVVDDDADDGDELDPDSTDLYEPDQGEPVASASGPPDWQSSHLEPAGADVKGPAYHGQQS
jgi:hypothetical protein